jgi:hypothetical protein
MAIIGNTYLWADFFPDDLIPEILEMVVDVWSSFSKPTINEHEVPITKRFRASLEQYKDSRYLPFRIDREVPVDNLDTAEELGRIDLRLTHGYRSDVYFALECKRLNITDNNGRNSSLAGKYVTEGMMRFVGETPQYARTLAQGGMIGYVMDGNVNNAIRSVNRQIKTRYVNLSMKSATSLEASTKSSKNLIKQSVHVLPDKVFTIYHVFLPS